MSRPVSKKLRKLIKAPKKSYRIELHVSIQYLDDGATVGKPVTIAKAEPIYIGPVDDPFGPFYVLGITKPVQLDPPPKFTAVDKDLAFELAELSGEPVTWETATKKRKRTTVKP
jgi:hypothetical protein